MKKEEIMVSICCITYNHEKYIKDALDSFLMQKTNFKYEIIVHDDASTDNTAKIVKEYEMKYPDIIKPIYQEENQYSKGIKASLLTYQKAQGKYVAVCEGDDYWTDENKLQIQVDYMETHPECTFCFHNAKILNMKDLNEEKYFIPQYKAQRKYIKKNNKYNVEELALLNEIPTASYVFKKIEFPKWYNDSIAGDLATQLICTSFGYAYYINKSMSVYRIGTGQSLMDKWKAERENFEKETQRLHRYIQLYENINAFTDYKYKETFEKIVSKFKLFILSINENKQLDESEYKCMIKKLNISNKIKLFIRVKYTKVFFYLKKIKNRRKYGKK